MKTGEELIADALRTEIEAFLADAPPHQRDLFDRIHAPLGGLGKLSIDQLKSAYNLCRRTAEAAAKRAKAGAAP